MRILIIIILAVLATGCVTKKRCADKYPPETHIEYREVIVEKEIIKYRDTTIYVELPPVEIEKSVIIEVPVTLYVAPIEAVGKYSSARAWIASQRLHLDLKEGGTLEVELKDAIKEIERLRTTNTNNTSKEVVRVPYTPKFWIITGWIGIIFIILVLIWIYKKFF
jgi:hypothetical protein